MPHFVMRDSESNHQIALKIAKLNCMAKMGFVPSPNTQQQVQQQAQQGQPVQQGPNAQAIGASGVTLDEVAQMLDQFYQETSAATQQTQQQIMGIQQQINAKNEAEGKGKGEGGGDTSNLEMRIAQLEQMLGGGAGVAAAGGPPTATPPQDPQAAMAAAPVPQQPTAPPPGAQQQPQDGGVAPMPGA